MENLDRVCHLCLGREMNDLIYLNNQELTAKIDRVFYFPLTQLTQSSGLICGTCKTTIEEFYWYAEQVASNQEQLSNKIRTELPKQNLRERAIDHSAEDNGSLAVDPLSNEIKLEILVEPTQSNDDSMTIDDANDNFMLKEESENVPTSDSEIEQKPTQKDHRVSKPKEVVDEQSQMKNEQKESSTVCIQGVSTNEEVIDKPTQARNLRSTNNQQQTAGEQSSKEQTTKLTPEQLVLQHYKLTCDICSAPLSDFSDLYKHYKLTHKVTGYLRCCNRSIYKKCWMIEHLQLHLNPDTFRCERCAKSYSSSKVLKEHIKEVHASDAERSFPCTTCRKAFVSRSHLNAHIMVAHDTVPCPQCEKVLSSRGSLRKHLVAVHGEGEKHVCEVCARVFRTKQCFEAHRKEHEGRRLESKVQCELCNAWLINKYCLTKHIRRKHTQHEGGEVVCETCGKHAPNQDALKLHMWRVHSGSRFECEWCHKKFNRPHHMKEHVAIHHTGEELYGCQHCSERFNTKNKLYTHRKTVHPQEYAAELRKRMLKE
ncbi:zinc finger protein 714-like [Anopheles funestus]|uniref:zinc finger protein 714-like n=1 Tax=Anopheles funestus TaxID=62324 RepID=UPI0020C6D4B1|nr:zinc finger protein 714-like [Anopheles funestus]